jgi:hypothetical protein
MSSGLPISTKIWLDGTGLVCNSTTRENSCSIGFAWRTEPYEFVADPPAIDLLTGSAEVRTAVEAGAALPDIEAMFAPFERAFAELRQPALLPEYQ